jgi:Ran GTPase-activating protein (RanGAP) involved in mRNA processing and transport
MMPSAWGPAPREAPLEALCTPHATGMEPPRTLPQALLVCIRQADLLLLLSLHRIFLSMKPKRVVPSSPLMELPMDACSVTLSYLPTTEILGLCTTSRWAQKNYPPHIRKLVIRAQSFRPSRAGTFLRRLSSLEELRFKPCMFLTTLAAVIRDRSLLKLRVLRLGRGQVRLRAMQDLAEALQHAQMPLLESLDLDGCEAEGKEEVVLPLAQALQAGSCPVLHDITMHGLCMGKHGLRALAEAFEARAALGCRRLSSLMIGFTELDPLTRAADLRRVLETDACACLSQLKLHGEAVTQEVMEGLCSYLNRTGGKLTTFTLRGDTDSVPDAEVLLEALAQASRLQKLVILDCDAAEGAMVTFAGAIRKGCFSAMKELHFDDAFLGDEDLATLMNAVTASHGFPALFRLTLCQNAAVGPDGAKALANTFEKGALLQLQELWLGGCSIGDAGLASIMTALRASGAKRAIRRLELFACDICRYGLDSLIEAVLQGALPDLELLNLGGNDLGDERVVELASALSAGCCKGLRDLKLWRVGMGDGGMLALAELLANGACPRLKHLSVHSNDDAGEDALQALSCARDMLNPEREVEVVFYYDYDED